MIAGAFPPRIAMVTGAGGQDGYYLTGQLLTDGWTVHAVARDARALCELTDRTDHRTRLVVHERDVLDAPHIQELIGELKPQELYNLAGRSSVSASFEDPLAAWRVNLEAVLILLEAVRRASPATRMYQASTSEMFGWEPSGSVVHDASSPLDPQSPYAAAKAAAHTACRTYRRVYGLRVACGILFNHESRRRGQGFVTRKVVDHVRNLRGLSDAERVRMPPLRMGNLRARRDWGFAPDFALGMQLILRQIEVRARISGRSPDPDEAAYYRDYVLGIGRLYPVWELVDRAFALASMTLEWHLQGEDPAQWCATYADTGSCAVVVDPSLLRPSDPAAIQADPTSACRELGWAPRLGLDVFLKDMLDEECP